MLPNDNKTNNSQATVDQTGGQNVQSNLTNQTQTNSQQPPKPPASEQTDNKNANQKMGNQADLSNIVVSPPSKASRKKVIATIFSIVVIAGGVIAGVILVQRQQEIRKQAASASKCNQSPDCEVIGTPGNSGSQSYLRTISHVFLTAQDYVRFDPGDTNDGCYHVIISGGNLSWEKVGSGSSCHDISNIQVWFGEEIPTPTPTQVPSPTPTTPTGITPSPTGLIPSPSQTPPPSGTPTITAECSDVKAYDTNWNLLTQADLASLQPGETVRFVVSGTTTSGSFDKARFTINGQLQSETTLKSPTNEFYMEYEIPSGNLNFTVTGEIHHTTLGWI